MSENPNKTLFFIKSPEHRLTAIESFLKKRNYTVIIETDIKEALLKVIEVSPDFVFIALDHPNPKVMSLPQIIDQSLLTHIVPFIYSSSKEEMRKLNYSLYVNKIFPPISGPAIERLVLKIAKEKAREEAVNGAQEEAAQKAADNKDRMIQVRSKAVENLESASEPIQVSGGEERQKKQGYIMQKGVRAHQIKSKNDFFLKAEKKLFSEAQKSALHKDFEEKVKRDLSDIIETYQNFDVLPNDHFQDDDAAPVRREPVIPTNNNKVKNKSQTLDTESEGGLRAQGLPDDMSVDRSGAILPFPNMTPTPKAFCLLIQSEEWCGYLVACSSVQLEVEMLETIFRNWINQSFKDYAENDNGDFFEIEIDSRSFKSWVESKSEFSENLNVNGSELFIGFIGLNPSEFFLHLDEENDLIEVQLELIPADSNLPLSLHLHLPENKKFLIYTPVFQQLSASQKKRLLEKKVDKLYTPTEYESELRRLKIKKYLDDLLEEMKRENLA